MAKYDPFAFCPDINEEIEWTPARQTRWRQQIKKARAGIPADLLSNCKQCIVCDVYRHNNKRLVWNTSSPSGFLELRSNFWHACDGTEISIVCHPSMCGTLEHIVVLSTEQCADHWPILYSGYLRVLETEPDTEDSNKVATNYFDFQQAAVEHIIEFKL